MSDRISSAVQKLQRETVGAYTDVVNVPHAQHHRGPHPEDHQLFTEESRRVLRRAGEEAQYLLDRGYSTDSVLDVVSRRHELRVRQRSALQRSMCSSSAAKLRQERSVSPESLQGASVEVDGFNLIIWVEVALSKGLLVRGCDGAYRDLAGLRGSYHTVEETELALGLLGTVFDELRVSQARFYLDQPVSNSGRLKERIVQHAESWSTKVDVLIVRNPDRELYGKQFVISSDAAVLDRVVSWFNLAEYLLKNKLEQPWVFEF